jgi:aryl-alcohol dehydrogenase-like predicted oxidoreductase
MTSAIQSSSVFSAGPRIVAARTVLPRSRLELSRIGLGLAHTHLLEAGARRRLIERALDLGITHFDTSRFYSDGLSETTLGRTLGARRTSMTITTKFGLLPTPLIGSFGPAAMPFRKGRSLLNKLGLVTYPMRSYSAATMRRALRDSLRALKTDYIDIYHVHDPLADTSLCDDLFEELRRAKTAGSIRLVGVSGADIDAVVDRYGRALDVVQSAESSWSEARYVPDITHSLFSEAVHRSSGALGSDLIRQLLERALNRRPEGAVIVQTRSPDRLAQIVEFAAEK